MDKGWPRDQTSHPDVRGVDMKLILAAVVLSLLAAPAVGQSPEKVAATWLFSDRSATAKASGISVPLKAGSLANFALRDASGDGADVAAQFESPDGKILGTIFIYAPTWPDPAVAFLATEESILRRFGAGAQRVEDRLVPVAGIDDGARRAVYTGIADAKLSGDTNGRIYSGAAFIRAGEWMIKIRVSGPISRSDEIARNLDALLAGMTFDKKRMPIRQTRIVPTDCAASPDRPSIKIENAPMADSLGLTIMLDPDVVDEKGTAMANSIAIPIDGLCREPVEVRDNVALQSFQVRSSHDGRFVPRRLVLYGDAGVMLFAYEDTKQPGRYFIARHSIGRTFIFGRTSGLPNKAELTALLARPDDQPAVIKVSRNHLNDKPDISINCSLTAEGCDKK